MGFQQGLSGLNATAKNLEIIGNNIANSNTYGAKAARAEFSDMYAAAMNGTGGAGIGIGVNLTTVAQQFTQGNIVTTENSLDLAINGSGFFQVSDGLNPTMYTRNGQFKVDREGYVVNNNGQKLMGYPADGTGTIQPGQAQQLKMPTAGITPQATANISLEMNLDSRAGVTEISSLNPPTSTTPTINFTDAKTYNNATSLTVYDTKGQDIALTYYFQKSAPDTWNVYVTANGKSLSESPTDPANPVDPTTNPMVPRPVAQITFPSTGSSPIGGTATAGSPGTVTAWDSTFSTSTVSTDGKITLPDIPSISLPSGGISVPLTGLELNIGTATQYGASFGVTDLSQDGYAPGQLVGLQFESNGIVMARYSNGQSKPAGQVEICTFRNPQGLSPNGGNTWSRTFSSGDPIVGVPGDGNLGKLQAGALEESNVDLTAELVSMITAQRVYQANAQTIKTEDQVLQTIVNLR